MINLRWQYFMTGLFVSIALCGCTQIVGIPSTAVSHAKSNHPAWTTGRPGTAWVYDASSHSVVYSGHLAAGQDISVDSIANDITIDGTPVRTNVLERSHEYEIFFQQDAH